jgi:hypothetical protein
MARSAGMQSAAPGTKRLVELVESNEVTRSFQMTIDTSGRVFPSHLRIGS